MAPVAPSFPLRNMKRRCRWRWESSAHRHTAGRRWYCGRCSARRWSTNGRHARNGYPGRSRSMQVRRLLVLLRMRRRVMVMRRRKQRRRHRWSVVLSHGRWRAHNRGRRRTVARANQNIGRLFAFCACAQAAAGEGNRGSRECSGATRRVRSRCMRRGYGGQARGDRRWGSHRADARERAASGVADWQSDPRRCGHRQRLGALAARDGYAPAFALRRRCSTVLQFVDFVFDLWRRSSWVR